MSFVYTWLFKCRAFVYTKLTSYIYISTHTVTCKYIYTYKYEYDYEHEYEGKQTTNQYINTDE